ncbi:MAG: 4Fe-4S binding protein [Nanobdellota archaeon]
MKISYWRRGFQIFFFILIIYGGFLAVQFLGVQKETIARGTEDTLNVIDASLPIHSCRYDEPKPTLFEGCGIRYLLDRPLYFSKKTWFAISLPILILLVLCFVFARTMCGWMCPLGFISDLIDSTRRKLKISHPKLSEKFRKKVKIFRYSLLLALIFLSLALITPFAYGIYMDKNFFSVACQICPARMVFPLLGAKLPLIPPFMTLATSIFSIIGFIFLAIYLSGIAITRAWCRICPNGAFISLFNKGAIMNKTKDPLKCTKCGVCKRICPMNNEYVYKEKKLTQISDKDCIMCFKCVENCPEKDCLQVKIGKKRIFSSKFKEK